MPRFEATLSDGRVVELESDHDPTPDEVLSSVGQFEQGAPPVATAPPISPDGLQMPTLDDSILPRHDPDYINRFGVPLEPPVPELTTGGGFLEELKQNAGDIFRSGLGFIPSGLRDIGVIATDPKAALSNFGRNVMDFIAPGQMNVPRTPISGVPEEHPAYRTGEEVEARLNELFPRAEVPGLDTSVREGFGQMGSMLGAGGLARAAGAGVRGVTAAATTMGGALEFDDAFKRSRQRGDSADEALSKSLGYTTVAAMTENRLGAGRVLRQLFPNAAEAAKKLTALGVSKKVIGNFVSGGAEEAGQRFAQNWIVDEKPSAEGMLEEGIPGAIVQGVTGLPAAGVGTRQATQRRQLERPSAAIDEAAVNQELERTQNAIQPPSQPIPGPLLEPEVEEKGAVEVPAAARGQETPKALTPVDEFAGGTRTVVHGGTGKFSEGQPAWFTGERGGAEWFAGERGGESPSLVEADVTINRPARTSDVEAAAKAVGATPDDIKSSSPYSGENPMDYVYVPKVVAELKRRGFDGLIDSDVLENTSIMAYVPFDKSQIKVKRTLRGARNKETGDFVYTPEGSAKAAEALTPASAAIRDIDTGEIWLGEPVHGLLHDKIPNSKGRNLEAGFATKDGKFISAEQSEKATGMASGEELFELSADEVRDVFTSRKEVASYDSSLTPEQRAARIKELSEAEKQAIDWKKKQEKAAEARIETAPEIQDFIRRYEALDLNLRTPDAEAAGMAVKNVADLQGLVDANNRFKDGLRAFREQIKAETDVSKKQAMISQLGKYGGVQYAREAIEAATGIGSVKRPDSPLNYRFNPEVREWLSKNADNIWGGESLKSIKAELESSRQPEQAPAVEEQAQPEPVAGAIATSPPLTTAPPSTVRLQPKAQREIIADLAKGLNIPIRFGRLTTRKFAGYFKPTANLIGSKKAVDIPTVSHEVGHKLDQSFGLSRDRSIASELDVLGDPATPGSASSWTRSKTRAYKMGEGVAEFVRYWLTDPPTAMNMAPNTHRAFEAALATNKDFGDVMRQAREDIQTWRNSEPQARLRSQIVSGNPNKTKYTGSQLIRDLVDDLHILRLASEHGAKTSPLNPSDNPYLLARNLRGSYGMADTFVRHGVTDFNTKEVQIGTSLADALKPVAGRLNDFRDWIVAKRAQELISQGRETGLVKTDVDTVAAKFDNDPVFQQAFADLKAWNDALLKYAVDSGLVTPESAAAMRRMNQDYVPFHRVFEIGAGEAPSQQTTGTGMGLNVGKPGSLKSLKGSTRSIADPLETMVQNAYTLITASEKAAINRAVARMADLPDMGRWVERVAGPNEAVRVALERIRKELEAAGADLTAVPDDLILTFFRAGRTAPFGENTIRVVRDGKQEFYRLNRDLHDTFKALDLEDTGTLIRILSAPAQLLRSGVVLEPSFNIANVLRDTFSSAVIGKYGAFPFQTTFKGVAAMLTKPQAIAEWAASGGKNAVEAIYFDRDRLKKFLADRISKDLTAAERALIVTKSPLAALRYMTSLFEEATRVGEYEIAYKKLTESGMPEGEARRLAAFESRDRQDFAKGGAKTKIIRHIAAFWNAALQANVKLLQSFKQRPVRTTLQGLAFITIPKLIEQALNWDDDDYWDRPQWERDLFFLIPTGKDETGNTRFLRLPTPFEVGIIFGTFPGRILEWMKTNRPDAMKGFPQLMLKNAVPNPIPQSGQMIFEDFLSGKQGWDVYRGRTIVPDSLADLPPELQWNEQTSRVAKEIGSRLGYSPMKVDHIIESTTGGLGKLATGRAEPFSRFVTRPLRVSNQPTEDFYIKLEEMRMQAARVKLTGEGDIPDDLKAYERTARTLSELRKEARTTDDEKRRIAIQKEMFDLISDTVKP